MISTYNLSMSVLYQTIRTITQNAGNNLPALTAFKSKYNAAYLLTMQQQLEAAEAMKSEQARSAEHEILRVEMKSLGADCRKQWQSLKRYIAEAYGSAQETIMWDAAGWQYYSDASNENWDKLREMMQMGSLFIDENKDTLVTLGYMPETFEDAFNEKRTSFNTKYDSFLLARENAEAGTSAKIAANNAIYEKTVALCLDAQVCFMDDEVKKKLFSIEAVSSLIRPTGSATVVVELRDVETNAIIEDFEVTNLESGRVAQSHEGIVEMGQQAEGSTQYRLTAANYTPQTITVDVQQGVRQIEHIKMSPVAVPEPVPVEA